MPQQLETAIFARQESPDGVLAKNLVTARLVARVTQQELANSSGISRATIAQIETGYSDPRLSTIVELARALGLPAILLLIGLPETRALSRVLEQLEANRPFIDPREVTRMQYFVGTGLLKDRQRAALIGAAAVETFSQRRLSRVSAAILSAFVPGAGTEIGAILGALFAEADQRPARPEAAGIPEKESIKPKGVGARPSGSRSR
jgi:transcriptional regulator with XRE-family HTH domain